VDKFIRTLSLWLQKQQKRTLIVITLVLVIIVWGIDYLTGPQLSTSLFYLVPISLSAWWINKRTAIGISILCAVAWLWTDIYTNPISINPLIPYWNAAVRLGFFLIVTIALSSLQNAKKRQAEMMSFIVHDLRAPVSNILMSLSFLKTMEEMPSSVEPLIEMSINSSQKMLIQVNSLLDLSQLENKKMQVVKSDVQVKNLVDLASNEVSALAAKKQILFQTEGVTDDLFVWADESLSVRIFVNLLNNAIKFSPSDRPVILSAKMNHQDVCFCIYDEGPGIPIKWQKQVFNKYAQVDARKSGVATGSGLGLAFCKAALEAQNGRIWLDAPANQKGTMICFTLPLSVHVSSIA
jgi:K+-sensing histidine kinase KdpD